MNLPRDQVRALSPQCKGFSVILSDMCPLVSGITTKDAALSAELGLQALDLAVGGPGRDSDKNRSLDEEGLLQPGGHLVIKLLESEDTQGGVHCSLYLFAMEMPSCT
uniref:rRNA methyltransferase 2, mitochondrial n=1 Tax=Rhizophora mucronata TaxID=61149 RepID=A0A2P2JFE4_RHIMU